jgi:hypothetical protein
MNDHLLGCCRRRRISEAKARMTHHFEKIGTCEWNNCNFRFRDKSCDMYSTHVTNHLLRMKSHRCLWASCIGIFNHARDLARHLSEAHDVPNERTLPTKHHYCYEHDVWCDSLDIWRQHILLEHFPHLNDYCGLLRIGGVVVIAAQCLFCLGDSQRLIEDRFAQFHDVNVLHQHMKTHLTKIQNFPLECPHPRCQERCTSAAAFWDHAISVHGVPPFGPPGVTKKRKAPEDLDEEVADNPISKRKALSTLG